MERLASILLGLESEFYSKAKINEKTQINLVVFSFVLVLLSCFISMFVIGLFVSGMIPVAVIISCLGTFVFVSIFRFSLTLIKPEIIFIKNINTTIFKSTLKEKWQMIKDGFKSFKRKVGSFRLSSDWPIPGFTLVFRLIYLSLIGFVLIFPLTTVTKWSDTMQYNNELRDEALLNYKNNLRAHKTTLTYNNQVLAASQMSWYEKKVQNEYYTMKLFIRATEYPFFSGILIFIGLVLFLPHYLLFNLMRNKSFEYFSLTNEFYKNIIDNDFKHLTESAEKFVKKKSYPKEKIDLSFLQKDNPYNKKIEIEGPENITWSEFQILKNTANNIP